MYDKGLVLMTRCEWAPWCSHTDGCYHCYQSLSGAAWWAGGGCERGGCNKCTPLLCYRLDHFYSSLFLITSIETLKSTSYKSFLLISLIISRNTVVNGLVYNEFLYWYCYSYFQGLLFRFLISCAMFCSMYVENM